MSSFSDMLGAAIVAVGLFIMVLMCLGKAHDDNEPKPKDTVSIVNVYNTNGKLIRSLKGKVDKNDSDGNKVTISVDGKEYVFYNCNIETFEAPKECTSSVPAVSSSLKKQAEQ